MSKRSEQIRVLGPYFGARPLLDEQVRRGKAPRVTCRTCPCLSRGRSAGTVLAPELGDLTTTQNVNFFLRVPQKKEGMYLAPFVRSSVTMAITRL